MFSRIRTTKAVQRKLLVAGVLGATVALAAAMSAGTASATASAPMPKGSTIPLGQGCMGVGYVQDNKDFKPDTRSLDLSTPEVLSPSFATNPPPGIDVSHYQGTINWASVKAAGIQFAYIKATEARADAFSGCKIE